MNYKLDELDYLTPSMAKENGVSKWKFYKYIKDNDGVEWHVCQ